MIRFAYYFPGYHYDPQFYHQKPETFSEWELVKNARPFFKGHYQPRAPLWGYECSSDQRVMGRKLKVSYAYNIQSLLFISYWYKNMELCHRPLEMALEAAGPQTSQPSIMWANHNRYQAYPEDGSKKGEVQFHLDYSWESCKEMIGTWTRKYFSHKNYYRLPNDQLFFSIYSPQTFVNVTGGTQTLRDFIEYLRNTLHTQKIGEVHIHACETRFIKDLSLLNIGFDSCSDYISLGYSENATNKEPYLNLPSLHGQLQVQMSLGERLLNIKQTYDEFSKACPITYYPVVTVGRDCSPRVEKLTLERKGHYSTRPIIEEFSPSIFKKHCEVAVEYLRNMNKSPKMLFLNAWNEWTEGAYLEPDTLYEYQFLDIVKALN